MNILDYTVLELINLLNDKKISSLEITQAYLNNMKKYKDINAYITSTEEIAISQAKASDQRRIEGNVLSKLDGIPIGIKDNFLTKGIKTTNASKFYSDFIPPYESTITQKLLDAGMVFLGKNNMDEFAMGSTNTTSYFGIVKNPWNAKDGEDRSPGGSSGGSAAAVAARIAPFTLGTDTGGSIRQPASFCGVVGLKPTYGLCSRFGIFSFASSLDQAGPMTRNVTDNALLLEVMSGYDVKETTMTDNVDTKYSNDLECNIKKFSVGVIKEYENYKINQDVKDAYLNTIKLLEKNGVEIKEVTLPKHDYVIPVYYIIAPIEASSNFARFDGIRFGNRAVSDNLYNVYEKSRSEGFGKEVKTRILIGTYNLLHENFHTYVNAAKVRSIITQDFSNIFEKVDFILSPTSANTAFNLHSLPNDPMELYYSDVFTVSANLAGLPAISLPYGLDQQNMPIGLQLMGNYFQEKKIYNISYWLEKQFAFNNKPNFLN